MNEIGFDDVLADFSFARLVRRHRSVREHETCETVRREMVNDVLHPGKIRVAHGWFSELPAFVVAQPVAAVAAETPALGDEALRLIEVRYEPLPFVVDPEAARRPDAPAVYRQDELEAVPSAGLPANAADYALNGNVLGPDAKHGRGDAAAGLARLALDEARVRLGPGPVAAAAVAASGEVAVEVESVSVMGVPVPVIGPRDLVRPVIARGRAPEASGPALELAAQRFEEMLTVAIRLATIEVRVRRLAREIRRTSSRSCAGSSAVQSLRTSRARRSASASARS